MSSPISLQNNSVYFFAAFIPFAIVAFGYNFFIRDLSSFVTVHHLHGIAMFAWLFMLVAQASLIRTKRRSLHRVLGKASYALVPFISVTTVLLAHYAFGTRLDTPVGSLILALQLFLLLQFLIIYGCAIKYRKVPEVHGRWMLGTAMPMIDPIFNRLIMYTLAPIFPIFELAGVFITFGATDLLIAALAYWDWNTNKRKDVFLPMLAICLATQLPILALLFIEPWQALWGEFGNWFINLPL
jgi:hypothetical protein